MNDEKIDLIRAQPEGDSMFTAWIGCLCLAMKTCDSGYLYAAEGIPYTTEHLARIFKINKHTVDQAIKAFEKLGMVSTNEGQIIQLTNFEKHQGVNALEKLREISRKSSYKYRKSQKLLENKKETQTKTKRKPVTVTSPETIDPMVNIIKMRGFNSFWKLYPKRIGKEAALRAWMELDLNEELIKSILHGLKRHLDTEEWKKENGRFIPNPEKFIRDRRWEDEIEVPKERNNPLED